MCGGERDRSGVQIWRRRSACGLASPWRPDEEKASLGRTNRRLPCLGPVRSRCRSQRGRPPQSTPLPHLCGRRGSATGSNRILSRTIERSSRRSWKHRPGRTGPCVSASDDPASSAGVPGNRLAPGSQVRIASTSEVSDHPSPNRSAVLVMRLSQSRGIKSRTGIFS